MIFIMAVKSLATIFLHFESSTIGLLFDGILLGILIYYWRTLRNVLLMMHIWAVQILPSAL